MLSLSRVNISYMCLNMSPSKETSWSSTLEPGLQVCMGHRHENGETE